jgi:hypothetical protein
MGGLGRLSIRKENAHGFRKLCSLREISSSIIFEMDGSGSGETAMQEDLIRLAKDVH